MLYKCSETHRQTCKPIITDECQCRYNTLSSNQLVANKADYCSHHDSYHSLDPDYQSLPPPKMSTNSRKCSHEKKSPHWCNKTLGHICWRKTCPCVCFTRYPKQNRWVITRWGCGTVLFLLHQKWCEQLSLMTKCIKWQPNIDHNLVKKTPVRSHDITAHNYISHLNQH